MPTISALSGAACSVKTDQTSFDVFPEKPTKDTWTLRANPEEEMSGKKILSWPGEYDFGGVTVRAIGQEDGRQVSYACNTEGVRMAFVNAPVLAWTDAQLERLGDVDVLVVAADDPKKVQPLVEAVDPRIIVLTETKGGDLAGVAKSCGLTSYERVSELKVKPSTLPQDSRQVIVLK